MPVNYHNNEGRNKWRCQERATRFRKRQRRESFVLRRCWREWWGWGSATAVFWLASCSARLHVDEQRNRKTTTDPETGTQLVRRFSSPASDNDASSGAIGRCFKKTVPGTLISVCANRLAVSIRLEHPNVGWIKRSRSPTSNYSPACNALLGLC